jgi:hypothetical protein
MTILWNLFSVIRHSRDIVLCIGRAIDQAVSRRLPTAAARVRGRVWPCGICGGQSDTGTDFLRVLRFPLPILIPSIALHSSSIVRDWYGYDRPISGRHTKWTQSHPNPIIWCMEQRSIVMSALSKTLTVFVRLKTVIVRSNPTRSIDVCMRLFCV